MVGELEYRRQTLIHAKNIGIFTQNDSKSGLRDSGVQIGSESEHNS